MFSIKKPTQLNNSNPPLFVFFRSWSLHISFTRSFSNFEKSYGGRSARGANSLLHEEWSFPSCCQNQKGLNQYIQPATYVLSAMIMTEPCQPIYWYRLLLSFCWDNQAILFNFLSVIFCVSTGLMDISFPRSIPEEVLLSIDMPLMLFVLSPIWFRHNCFILLSFKLFGQ